jgi:hypothetical protein
VLFVVAALLIPSPLVAAGVGFVGGGRVRPDDGRGGRAVPGAARAAERGVGGGNPGRRGNLIGRGPAVVSGF